MSEHLPIVAMYMALGAERVLQGMRRETYEIISDHNGGHIGVMESVVLEVARHVASRLDEVVIEEWPGVFDYEVSEPLGGEVVRALAEGETLPTMCVKADQMMKEFFEQ